MTGKSRRSLKMPEARAEAVRVMRLFELYERVRAECLKRLRPTNIDMVAHCRHRLRRKVGIIHGGR